MRALLVALLLAIVTAVPAFADDDGGDGMRTPAPTVDVGGPGTWAP